MLFGLGLPEWLAIIGLLGGLVLTFYVMARASVAYEAKREQRREAGSAGSQNEREAGSAGSQNGKALENQSSEEESGT